jgi:hypothetical protein
MIVTLSSARIFSKSTFIKAFISCSACSVERRKTGDSVDVRVCRLEGEESIKLGGLADSFGGSAEFKLSLALTGGLRLLSSALSQSGHAASPALARSASLSDGSYWHTAIPAGIPWPLQIPGPRHFSVPSITVYGEEAANGFKN